MVDCKTIVFFFSKSVLENEAPKSRVYKGQTGVEFFGCFVFEIGCFVLRSSFSSASFSKLPEPSGFVYT